MKPETGRRERADRPQSKDRNRYALWVGLLLAPFFLRGTSLPVPLSHTLLYYACYLAVAVVAAGLLLTGAVRFRLAVTVVVLGTVPSLYQAELESESVLRWVAWVVILAAVGPLVVSAEARRYRRHLWDTLRWIFLGVSCASFVVWVVGDLGLPLSGRGVFYGVMSHSMVLAPIAALTTIDCLYRYLRERERVWLGLMAIAIITLLLCGSRAASLGALVGSVWIILNAPRSTRRYGLAGVTGVLVVLTLLDGNVLSGASETTRHTDSMFTEVLRSKNISDTRTWLWEARLQEFQDSMVAGIGFARTRYGRISTEGSYIEPGSSYLAILSMTGLVGGIGWLVLAGTFWATYLKGARSLPRLERLHTTAVAAFFGVHLAFEGYIYAPGSLVGLIFYAWLAVAWDSFELGVHRLRIAPPLGRSHCAGNRGLRASVISPRVAVPTEG